MPFALAVDFGGTKVEAALIDDQGQLAPGSRFRAPTGNGSASGVLVEAVTRVVRSALALLPASETLVGAGIGSAGPVNRELGTVSPINVPAWRNFDLRQLVASEVPGVATVLALDGLCITLAERWVGAGRGSDNLMGMVVSTGVGGGLVINGRIITGSTGNAGHIGQLEVAGFTDLDVHGDRASLEQVASGPHTVAWARAQGWAGTTGEELGAAYASGDPIAIRAVRRSATAVGRAIASATALVDLDLVVIGGGFSRVSPDYFDLIRESVNSFTEHAFLRKAKVLPSGLQSDGPLIGAAVLAHQPELI
jgi:glucokinase